MRSVFYDDFVNKKIAFRDEDLYEIGLVYFISQFLHSELPRTFIKKAHFDLVELGHYLKYDWGDEYGALLWNYATRKQNDGAVSESEATENVISKHGGFKRSREQFGSSMTR
ncbi:hypothetical protein CQW23_28253 [Capsicum baccatum]|uniref:DUF1985 domain-containing protein n=1 Tax=Capsicum baccatum TaxID=33114 RepID=A0A2G2VG09_CAPBA|nr:hypothetical protein CQW23_28253 [Capsicum baccatum]